MEDDCTPTLGVALRAITLEDRPVFQRALSRLRAPISDTSFTTSFLWAEPLELSWTEIEGHLCVFSSADGDLSMMLPPLALADGLDDRLAECVDRCFEIMDDFNAPRGGTHRSRIEYVSDEALERLRAAGCELLSAGAMGGDYVYPTRSIIELAGGDLKSKRRLRNLFIREHPSLGTAPLRRADVPECMALLERWKRQGDEDHEGEANDHLIGTDVLRSRDAMSTRAALNSFEDLGLETLVVRVDGRVAGFSLGERLTRSMAVIYVEKTDPDLEGAPQFIYSEFCRQRFADCVEVNAGDDWGIASLRFAKSTYRPSRMLAKNVLTRQPALIVGGGEPELVATIEPALDASHAEESSLPPAIHLREAVKGDAEAIGDVERASFDQPVERFSVRQTQRLIANPRARVIVAEHRGMIVGWAVSLVRTHRRWRSGRLYALAVDPGWSGQGIGRQLVEDTLWAFEQAGVARVYLEVRADNARALALYESMGFEAIRKLRAYYGPGSDAMRMRRVAIEPAHTEGTEAMQARPAWRR